jgi:hypothetical protein
MSPLIHAIEVKDHGQIASLSIPQRWIEKPMEKGEFELQTIRTFHPRENPAVRLSLYYRGCAVRSRSATNFANILSLPEHELDEEERWLIQEVLRDAALPDAFQLALARTADCNGRRNLVVTGSWPRSQESSFTMYIHPPDDPSQIQEIVFVAPENQYRAFWGAVERSLLTIRWKD